MFIPVELIFEIAKQLIQIIVYIVIFFKLHKLKGDSPMSITDILKKGKELFTQYIGKLDGNAILKKLFKLEIENKDDTDGKKDG